MFNIHTGADRIPFFFNDTATTEIYTLSLHDALPIYTKFHLQPDGFSDYCPLQLSYTDSIPTNNPVLTRSEEHTSELQSQSNLVCRLLLEKKKTHNLRNISSKHKTHTYRLPHYSSTRC